MAPEEFELLVVVHGRERPLFSIANEGFFMPKRTQVVMLTQKLDRRYQLARGIRSPSATRTILQFHQKKNVVGGEHAVTPTSAGLLTILDDALVDRGKHDVPGSWVVHGGNPRRGCYDIDMRHGRALVVAQSESGLVVGTRLTTDIEEIHSGSSSSNSSS
jgi:hypothetical protein